MNESHDPFDWSSLGDTPLPGEVDDDALLDAVLGEGADVIEPVERRWIKPAIVAAVVLAAAVVFVLAIPSWRQALAGANDSDRSMAPDVEAPRDTEGDIERRPIPGRPGSAPPAASPRSIPSEPDESENDSEIHESAFAEARPRSRTRTRAPALPSPEQLLRDAQDARAAKNTREAKRLYAALIRRHPKSAEAHAARVSLGRLELRAGRPKKALAHYEAYLANAGGSLRREAKLGRIEALEALGRTDLERAAIESFLREHPRTVHGSRLHARLGALR